MMLGLRIALLRISKGWSRAELGRQLGVSTSAVGMYEQGRREPSLDIVSSLSQVFGVTTDYLMTGENLDMQEPVPVTIRVEALLQCLYQMAKEEHRQS